MAMKRSTYPIEIAGIYRELPLFEVQPGLRIAVLNILGDTELVRACESWARNLGLSVLASDAELDNETSQAAHVAVGFAEVERAVHFAKKLD